MLKIFYSPLNEISSNGVIELLKSRDKTKRHIIITPDRASLNYEKKIFSLTNESSFFDVSVTTLTRFCNSVISKYGQQKKVLSKMSGVAIVKKILLENKNSFKIFKRNVSFKNFAFDVYNILCMFKSNNITPAQILCDVVGDTLKDKLFDLDLIYNEYEKYLQTEFTDSFNRLNLCKSLISKDNFSDTNIYLLHFDDFTKQAYAIIEKLMKCANDVYVSTTFAKSSNDKRNAGIYLNNIYYSLIDIAKNNDVPYELSQIKFDEKSEFAHLCNNALGLKTNKFSNVAEKIEINEYSNLAEEIRGVVAQIKMAILNGKRYNDFAILVPSLMQNKKLIEDILKEYDVKYFIDENEQMVDSLVSQYILNVLDLKVKMQKECFLNVLKSVFFTADDDEIFEYENHINKYGIKGKGLLDCSNFKFNENLLCYNNFINTQCKTAGEYINGLLNLLQETGFENTLEILLAKYFENNDLLAYKKLQHIKNKLDEIFNEILNVMSDVELDAKTFKEIFECYLENVSIVMPPILADAVFVGDIVNSYLNKRNNVFILSFNDGIVPNFASDDGIITDDEIATMSLDKRLSPSVNFVNKKTKFKVFESLFLADEKLTLSYHIKSGISDCYPSAYLVDIAKFMNINIVNKSLMFNEVEHQSVGFNKENLIFNNFNKRTALKNLLKNIKLFETYKDNKNYITLISTLKDSIRDDLFYNNICFKNEIQNLKKHNFFEKGYCGVSELEKYYRCPYMHYVDYGLRLYEDESEDVKANIIGNIIHEFLKIAVPKLMEEDVNILTLRDEILSVLFAKKEYEHIVLNKNNNFLLKELYEECGRICEVILHVNKHSSFKPKEYEKKFTNESVLDVIINGKKLSLIGFIDRIDEYDNKLMVLDYKTGNSSFSDYSDVFYGKKMQLIVYLMALNDKNKVPVGAFYMPISNSFSKQDKKDIYKLKGIVNTENISLVSFDDGLNMPGYNSDIIPVGTDNKASIKQNNNFYKNMCLNNQQMQILYDYVKQMLKEAALNIFEGNIKPQPLSGGNITECEYCKYKGMCNFNLMYKNKFKKMEKKISVSDLIKKEDDE